MYASSGYVSQRLLTCLVACLLGAIQLVARGMGKTEMAKNAKVHVSVHLGEPKDMEGFGIGVDIKVEGIDDELLQAGHAVRRVYVCTQTLD